MSAEDADAIVYAHSYDVHLQSPVDTQRLVYRHTVSSLLTHTTAPMKDQSTSRIMTNDPYFNSTVTRISDSEIFFPAPELYKIDCTLETSNATCSFGKKDFMRYINERHGEANFRVRISHDAQKAPDDVRNYWVRAISALNTTQYDEDYDGVDSIACEDNFGVVSTET